MFRVCLNCKCGLKILIRAFKCHFCPKTIKSLRRIEILTFGQHALMHIWPLVFYLRSNYCVFALKLTDLMIRFLPNKEIQNNGAKYM